jgi:hypothetical protein
MQGRLLALLVAVVSLLAVTAGAANSAESKQASLDRIDLPNGWQPEGVASAGGHTLFVGSIPTGAVLQVDARSGASSIAVPGQEGRAAIGLKADRAGRLFVAGGPTGKAFVYDAHSGGDLAEFQLAPSADTFVNDVALTRKTAYFTDSRRAVIYRVATDLSGAAELPLRGFDLQPEFNLNGIVATSSRKGRHAGARRNAMSRGGATTLLAVQSNTGRLWRINPKNGRSTPVDLGGVSLTNGDGLLLEGRTLYVVRNQLNQIAVVHLGRGLRRGEVVRTITSDQFDVPTTLARSGDSLYAVNARFNTEPTPDTEYWLTRVP